MIKFKKKKIFFASYLLISIINFILNLILFNIFIIFFQSNISAIFTMIFSSGFAILTTIKYYKLKKDFPFISKFILSILSYRVFDFSLFNLLKYYIDLDVSILWFFTLVISFQTKIIFYYLFFKNNIKI